jgi:hypothetical protein
MNKKKLMALTFDKIGDQGSPMTVVGGMRAYAEATKKCMPTVGNRYLVRLRYMDKKKGFMIFTPIRQLKPNEQVNEETDTK